MKKNIDDIVKDALSDLEVPYDPNSWQHMQERMDNEIIDQESDETIKSQVSNLHVTYQHKHWLQLKDWLDYTWYASNKIYISKSAEFGLMLLALFTFFNYNTQYGVKSDNPQVATETYRLGESGYDAQTASIFSESANTEEPTLVTESQILKVASNDVPQIKSTALKGAGVEASNGMKTNTRTTNNQKANTSRPPSNAAQSSSSKAIASTETNGNGSNQGVQSGDVEEMANAMTNEASTESLDQINEPAYVDVETGQHAGSSIMSSLGVLPILDMELFDAYEKELNSSIESALVEVKARTAKKWSISAFADLDFNHISTPYDDLYQKSGYNQNRVGTGGGLVVHRDIGPVELSTGLGYSSKQYSPKEFIELFKKSPESEGTAYRFEGINLNLLTIPVHASYFISKSGKWRPYVAMGGALHLALQARYEKDTETISSAIPIPQFVDENEGATVTVGRTPNFEKKSFPDGLLGDGSFRDNYYFTLDLAVGVERKISPSTSLFVQPTVYYNIFNKGLSANNDKINTFSLQIGAKTKI